MGNTWEVSTYGRLANSYGYTSVWVGQSVIKCIRAAIKAKRAGAGCVKVEWR